MFRRVRVRLEISEIYIWRKTPAQQLYNGNCRVLSRVKECFKLRTHLRVEDQHVCISVVECHETSFQDVAM